MNTKYAIYTRIEGMVRLSNTGLYIKVYQNTMINIQNTPKPSDHPLKIHFSSLVSNWQYGLQIRFRN